MGVHIPIVPGQIRLPQPPSTYAERGAEAEYTQNLLRSPLTLLTAPAGYGKTAFLSRIAKNSGRPTSWISLFAHIDEIHFSSYLIAAVAQVFPGWGKPVQELLQSGSLRQNAELFCAQFAEELWLEPRLEASGGLVMILDDCQHLISSPLSLRILQGLLTYLPESVKLCLSSRETLPLPLARLELQGRVYRLGAEELRFRTAGELTPLLDISASSEAGLNLTALQEALTLTNGWITGLLLYQRYFRQTSSLTTPPVPSTYNNLAGKPASALGFQERLYAFFLEELLHHERPAMRKFLLQISALHRLNPADCQVLLGPESPSLLREAYERGLFIQRLEGTEELYRLHDLLREAVRRQARESGEEPLLRSLLHKAVTYYESLGKIDLALSACFDLEDPQGAADLLQRQGELLLQAGFINELLYWLRRLPSNMRTRDPELLYLWGFVHQQSDPDEALRSLSLAADGFAARHQIRRQVQALIIMATLYSLQNKVDKVRATARRIPVLTALVTDPWSRGVLLVSSMTQAVWDDQLAKARHLYRLARTVPLDPDWLWALRAYACMLFYRAGDLSQAETVITQALSLPVVQQNPMWRGLALTLWHVVLYSRNDRLQCTQVADELWTLGERFDSDYYRAYAERSRAMTDYHRAAYDPSLAHFSSSHYYFTRIDNEGMQAITELDMGVVRLAQMRAQGLPQADYRLQALAILQEKQEALKTLRRLQAGQGLLELGESLCGLLAREAEVWSEAEKLLRHSLKVSRRKGAKQIIAGTSLHLADLLYRTGKEKEADNLVREAWQLMARHSYTLVWDYFPATLHNMGERALALGIEPDFVHRVLKTWMPVTPAKIEPAPAEPRIRLEVISLGQFAVRLDGQPLPTRAWKSRKALTLFKYLLLQHDRPVTRDELIELLWPDAEPEAGAASLRVTLTRLRKALSPAAIPAAVNPAESMTDSVLLETKGHIALNPVHIRWDAREFKNALQQALHYPDTFPSPAIRAAHLSQALTLYQGELLPEDRFSDWAALERDHLLTLYQEGCLTLARYERQQAEASLSPGSHALLRTQAYLQRALNYDPYREEIYLELAEIYLFRQEKALAHRTLTQIRELLHRELDIAPSERWQILWAKSQ